MSNNLNQYTSIQEASEAAFTPQFDADGNQTLIKTEIGIWTAVYNAENRPVSFTNEATGTVVSCAYDSMGRRSFKKVTVNGTVTLHRRYLYRVYLQIACCDLTRTAYPCLWLITWDPSEPIATRPLAIQKDGTWYTYGLDLTKNVSEVFGSTGYITTTYTYSPYGSVTATGSVTQPIRWSSEYRDEETGLVYYNWRYYNPLSGKWNRRDKLESGNQICYVYNSPIMLSDVIGLAEENFCCPNKIVVNFTRSLKISTEELKELDDSLKKEWENYMRVHHKNAKVKDEALTKKGRREMKGIPYPVVVSDKGIANAVEGELRCTPEKATLVNEF